MLINNRTHCFTCSLCVFFLTSVVLAWFIRNTSVKTSKGGWPILVLWVFGLSWPIGGCGEGQLPFKGSTGVSCSSFQACTRLWHTSDAVELCRYATLQLLERCVLSLLTIRTEMLHAWGVRGINEMLPLIVSFVTTRLREVDVQRTHKDRARNTWTLRMV